MAPPTHTGGEPSRAVTGPGHHTARAPAASVAARWTALERAGQRWLVRHSVTALRIALGAVFLGFGLLKYLPGVSPAADLAVTTTRLLTLGLLPPGPALVLVATVECVIGVLLLAGRCQRLLSGLLAVEVVGILSPVVLVPGRLFTGPGHAPTLEGQYVLKDVILFAAAGLVIAALHGARLVDTRSDHPAPAPPSTAATGTVTRLNPSGRSPAGRAPRPGPGRRSFSCAATLTPNPTVNHRTVDHGAAGRMQ